MTNKAVFTCYAKNQEGDAESRKAVVTNGIVINFWLFIIKCDSAILCKNIICKIPVCLTNKCFTKKIFFEYLVRIDHRTRALFPISTLMP